jgi:hypothetical protein
VVIIEHATWYTMPKTKHIRGKQLSDVFENIWTLPTNASPWKTLHSDVPWCKTIVVFKITDLYGSVFNLSFLHYFRKIALSGSTFENENMCQHLSGLNRKQIRVCKRNVELMPSVKRGAEMAIQECQHQFKYRKWNCTTINKHNEPVFGNALNKGKILYHLPITSRLKTNYYGAFNASC